MKQCKPHKLARKIAFKDIQDECKKTNTINYIYYERLICWFLDMKKPDFRCFNGGYHKKNV